MILVEYRDMNLANDVRIIMNFKNVSETANVSLIFLSFVKK